MMQCKKCFGRGLAWSDEESYGPCTECHGYGIVHCCEPDIPDVPNLGMVDEPIKRAKVNVEIYDPTKEKVIVTGYEITYAEVAPLPLIKEVADMLMEHFYR